MQTFKQADKLKFAVFAGDGELDGEAFKFFLKNLGFSSSVPCKKGEKMI